jgi:hypothetical protein
MEEYTMSESLESMMVRLGMKRDPDLLRKTAIELGVIRDPDGAARQLRAFGHRVQSLDEVLQQYRRQLPWLWKEDNRPAWERGNYPATALGPYGQEQEEEPEIRIEAYRYGMPLEGGFRLYGNDNTAIIQDPSTGLSFHHHDRGGGAVNYNDRRLTILPWDPYAPPSDGKDLRTI